MSALYTVSNRFSIIWPMDSKDVFCVLKRSKVLLEHGGKDEELSLNLSELSSVIQASSEIEDLADEFDLLDLCLDAVTNSLLFEFTSETEEQFYVRLLRAVVLLIRNLVAFATSRVDIPLLLLNIQHFQSQVKPEHPFFHRTIAAYLEVLANMALKEKQDFRCNLQLASDTFNSQFLDLIEKDNSNVLLPPFLIIIDGCTQQSENVSALLKDEIHAPLLNFLYQKGTELLEEEDISSSGESCIRIFEKILSHESYNNWLVKSESAIDQALFQKVLKLNQLVVTSKEDWNNYECTAILAWCFDFFKKWAEEAIVLLKSKVQDDLKLVHSKVLISLDIISDLCKYHAAKQYMENYDGLPVLIALLRAAHENTAIVTMKSKFGPFDETKKMKHFPIVKSLIIEILAYLCHDSFKTQEKLRELHGLELILSNCIIDENNPYIKERSTLCLRFVLEKNKANQDFVAQLEAKQVYDDKALQEVGYEVDIVDGQVKLKKAA